MTISKCRSHMHTLAMPVLQILSPLWIQIIRAQQKQQFIAAHLWNCWHLFWQRSQNVKQKYCESNGSCRNCHSKKSKRITIRISETWTHLCATKQNRQNRRNKHRATDIQTHTIPKRKILNSCLSVRMPLYYWRCWVLEILQGNLRRRTHINV